MLGSFGHNAVKRPMPFLCEKGLNFYDLRTFVAKFCRENLRTFSIYFFGLKSQNLQTPLLFGNMSAPGCHTLQLGVKAPI